MGDPTRGNKTQKWTFKQNCKNTTINRKFQQNYYTTVSCFYRTPCLSVTVYCRIPIRLYQIRSSGHLKNRIRFDCSFTPYQGNRLNGGHLMDYKVFMRNFQMTRKVGWKRWREIQLQFRCFDSIYVASRFSCDFKISQFALALAKSHCSFHRVANCKANKVNKTRLSIVSQEKISCIITEIYLRNSCSMTRAQ